MRKQQFNLPQATWRQLKRELRQTDSASCAAAIGGLLTVPRFAAYDFRLEALAHLTVAYARGNQPLTPQRALHWLDGTLTHSTVVQMEELPEDVFVANVHTPSGNYRLFDGPWDSAHAHLQQLLDCLLLPPDPQSWGSITKPVQRLLRLSDTIAQRSEFSRWTPPADPPPSGTFGSLPDLESVGHRVSFSIDDLRSLDIQPNHLDPFILPRKAWSTIQTAPIVESDLVRRPLLRMNDTVTCILPSAISIAARHYILAAAARLGRLAELAAQLRILQETLLFRDIVPQLRTVGRSPIDVEPVAPEHHYGIFSEWRLDDVTIAAVAIFHDNLPDILEYGFDSAMELSPEAWRAFLRRIETLSRQHETVFGCVVVAGLGRGVSLDVSQLPQSSKLPVISLPDLHVFSSQEDASLLRLVKLAQHEDAMRTQGVTIVNMSGILNLFAFWEARGYALVPDDLHLPHPNTTLVVPHDCLRDVRIRERTNLDRHAVRAPSGTEEVVVVERLPPTQHSRQKRTDRCTHPGTLCSPDSWRASWKGRLRLFGCWRVEADFRRSLGTRHIGSGTRC